jgi:hypothetical protein
MSRTLLLFLQNPLDVKMSMFIPELRTAVTVNHQNLPGRKPAGGLIDVFKKRFAGQAMHHFGQVRMHAFALPGGENNDAETHGVMVADNSVQNKPAIMG